MPIRRLACLAALGLLLSCDRSPESVTATLNKKDVTLPGGQKISAEVMLFEADMARGMMFRDSLAPDKGMLFVHTEPGRYAYWMYQVRIPLDIIWMDADHRIVEISANTPPCKTKASDCPKYGGDAQAQYVLELAGGMAAKYGLREGQIITF
jgi:uncharacterized membrane protein (UPF0127 family)